MNISVSYFAKASKDACAKNKKILAGILFLSMTAGQASAAISWESIKNSIDSITWESVGKAISSFGNSVASSSWSSVKESVTSFIKEQNLKAPTFNTSKWDYSNTLTAGLALAATSYAICTLWPHIKSKFKAKKDLATAHLMPTTIKGHDTNDVLHAGLKSLNKRRFLMSTILQAGLATTTYLASPLAYGWTKVYKPALACAIVLSVYRLGKVAIKNITKQFKRPRTVYDRVQNCTSRLVRLDYESGELKKEAQSIQRELGERRHILEENSSIRRDNHDRLVS